MEAADCVFLACVSLASSLWYLTRIGFYSDDWELIETFRLSPFRSLSGLLRSNFFIDRPAQGVYSVLLYRLFGVNPLGYHVVNAVVLVSISVLLYLVLRRVQPSRLVALGVALVYCTLPNYSTCRMWFAVFAAPLSIAFYLLSLLLDLRAAPWRGARFMRRRAAAVAALLVSALLYETALPLFAFNPLIVWYSQKRGRKLISACADENAGPSGIGPTRLWLGFAGVNAIVLVSVGIFKARTAARFHAPQGMVALVRSIAGESFRGDFRPGDYGLNFRAAFQANYVDYLLQLPRIVWALQRHYPHAWLPALSFAFGAGVLLYVKSVVDDLTVRRSIALILIGVATFVLGYAIFFTNRAIQITPTGVGNRTSNAASLGVAMTAVGGFGLIAAAVRRPAWRRLTFGVLIGAYAAAGFFVIATLSSFWIDAYAREQEIVRDIAAHIDTPAPRILLMLGGVCSYNGPAVVFESDWDLAGALRLHYGDSTVRADVLRPGYYRVTPSGITTFLYGEQDDDAFGPQMVLYDYNRKMSHVLLDADTAERIFREQPPDVVCPPGKEGVGAGVF
ncbi:MAG TPA: hypothetical protein VGZ27_18325 [Vicinamibacterales bacterium]|nr:hypothetical protein [Vicinamibacterales bacterium]